MATPTTPNKQTNFIILLGGPGKFMGCDKAHDQTWKNYIVPIQLAAQKKLFNKQPNENIHLLVYEPYYRDRWDDDLNITKKELGQSDGFWLHSTRQKAAQKVNKDGAQNYLHRIKQIAHKHNIKYVGLNKKDDFWTYIKSLPNASISRVWFSGHAAPDGLMLGLFHDSSCGARSKVSETIMVADIDSSVAAKFDTNTKTPSKFFGCYTYKFAKKWHNVYKVPTEGAVNKIDFGSIDRPSTISNILERIEKTPTKHGPTQWTKFK